jgi:hypothetical protein
MESYNVSKPNESEFHIDGFPDAVKVISISGEKAREAADLTSHRSDLNFAAECAEKVRQLPDEHALVRQALWRCAVFHYFKCFATGARSPLSKDAIYDNDSMGLEVFEYFLHLRNKHLAHDVNAYAQCLPGAVLNSRDAPAKIAKIVFLNLVADTLNAGNLSNLGLLIDKAIAWVRERFDLLCNDLTQELEAIPYDTLLSRESVTYTAPTLTAIRKRR